MTEAEPLLLRILTLAAPIARLLLDGLADGRTRRSASSSAATVMLLWYALGKRMGSIGYQIGKEDEDHLPEKSPTIVTTVGPARGAILREMLEAAEWAKVSIETTQITHASGPVGSVTSATIPGIENITAEQLKQGADLMFIHVSPIGARLVVPEGFYIARVTADLATKQGECSLIDRTGKSGAELPMTIEPEARVVIPRARADFSGGRASGRLCLCFDIAIPALRLAIYRCVDIEPEA